MEFTLLLLAAAGAWLLWRTRAARLGAGAEPTRPRKPPRRKKHQSRYGWQDAHWPPLVVVSAILTAAAILGWWSTEVLYAEQVIYSYDSAEALRARRRRKFPAREVGLFFAGPGLRLKCRRRALKRRLLRLNGTSESCPSRNFTRLPILRSRCGRSGSRRRVLPSSMAMTSMGEDWSWGRKIR